MSYDIVELVQARGSWGSSRSIGFREVYRPGFQKTKGGLSTELARRSMSPKYRDRAAALIYHAIIRR
jgi:hypothetical protein